LAFDNHATLAFKDDPGGLRLAFRRGPGDEPGSCGHRYDGSRFSRDTVYGETISKLVGNLRNPSFAKSEQESDMPYVDGFIVAVPKTKMADYKKIARKHGKVWREHGALAYVECVGDDVPYGKRTSFPRAVKAKDNETIVFSWIVYKSRAHRDAVLKKAMGDARMKMDMSKMPFDGKRMIYGGFKTFLAM
jgi:uncharacterized protein YbaA (DUF1428 family)